MPRVHETPPQIPSKLAARRLCAGAAASVVNLHVYWFCAHSQLSPRVLHAGLSFAVWSCAVAPRRGTVLMLTRNSARAHACWRCTAWAGSGTGTPVRDCEQECDGKAFWTAWDARVRAVAGGCQTNGGEPRYLFFWAGLASQVSAGACTQSGARLIASSKVGRRVRVGWNIHIMSDRRMQALLRPVAVVIQVMGGRVRKRAAAQCAAQGDTVCAWFAASSSCHRFEPFQQAQDVCRACLESTKLSKLACAMVATRVPVWAGANMCLLSRPTMLLSAACHP